MRRLVVLFVLIGLAVPGAALAKKRRTGKGPCKEAAQCKKNVCVEINGDSYCSKSCGQCPAGMYCDDQLFSMLGLKVCVKGRAKSPVKPEAPPRLPCKIDKECSGALVCAQKMGQRDCTLECTSDADCEMPEMLGVKFDFMECALDEGRRGRKACLPKDACLKNPMSCMKVNTETMGAMMGGMAEMAKGMGDAAEATADKMDGGAGKAEPEPTAGPAAMDESRFSALLTQVEEASFWSERKPILSMAAKHNHFSCAQVGRVIAVLSFGSEKIDTVKILAPKIVDRENSHTILQHLDFESEKRKVRAILDQ